MERVGTGLSPGCIRLSRLLCLRQGSQLEDWKPHICSSFTGHICFVLGTCLRIQYPNNSGLNHGLSPSQKRNHLRPTCWMVAEWSQKTLAFLVLFFETRSNICLKEYWTRAKNIEVAGSSAPPATEVVQEKESTFFCPVQLSSFGAVFWCNNYLTESWSICENIQLPVPIHIIDLILATVSTRTVVPLSFNGQAESTEGSAPEAEMYRSTWGQNTEFVNCSHWPFLEKTHPNKQPLVDCSELFFFQLGSSHGASSIFDFSEAKEYPESHKVLQFVQVWFLYNDSHQFIGTNQRCVTDCVPHNMSSSIYTLTVRTVYLFLWLFFEPSTVLIYTYMISYSILIIDIVSKESHRFQSISVHTTRTETLMSAGCASDGDQGETRESLRLYGQVPTPTQKLGVEATGGAAWILLQCLVFEQDLFGAKIEQKSVCRSSINFSFEWRNHIQRVLKERVCEHDS